MLHFFMSMIRSLTKGGASAILRVQIWEVIYWIQGKWACLLPSFAVTKD